MKLSYKISLSLLIFFPLSFFSGISSEEDSVQSQIRSLINSGKYQEAGEVLKPLLENNPTDVTLGLFQTEIWIGIGESLYQKKQYKSAFPYFSKAFEAWPSHPLLRSRYEELRGKKLVDQIKVESQPKVGKLTFESQTKNTLIVLADPEVIELTNQLKSELKSNIQFLQNTRDVSITQKINSDNYIKYSLLVLLGLSLSVNLFLLRRK